MTDDIELTARANATNIQDAFTRVQHALYALERATFTDQTSHNALTRDTPGVTPACTPKPARIRWRAAAIIALYHDRPPTNPTATLNRLLAAPPPPPTCQHGTPWAIPGLGCIICGPVPQPNTQVTSPLRHRR